MLRYGLNRQSPLNAARRHWIIFFRYHSWRKTRNLIRVVMAYLLRKPVVKGYPFFLKIEPTSRCNLRCPGCIAHGTDFPLEEGDISFDLFRVVCDELGDYLYKISLYITGEPLLYHRIYDMVAYAANKRIGTVISTNFHAFNEEKAARMISSGLSHLIVCLDGITQEVYEKYRVGGKLEIVLRNLETLMKKKAQERSVLPFVEIQAIPNEHNRDELPQIRRLAYQLGVDRFTLREDLRKYRAAQRDRTCFWLWLTALVNERGIVLPCCASAWMKDARKEFGDVRDHRFSDVWNNEKYQVARKTFSRKSKRADAERAETSLCAQCAIFHDLRKK